jgi:hypothetical protein
MCARWVCSRARRALAVWFWYGRTQLAWLLLTRGEWAEAALLRSALLQPYSQR